MEANPSATGPRDGSGPRISVCICTRNRPDALALTLDSIRQSAQVPHEVIVSDDSTDGATRSLVEQGYPEVSYRPGPRRGLGPNRNVAVGAATGDAVVFIDDDCLLGKSFLLEVVACLRKHDAATTIITGCETKNGILVTASDQSFLGFQKRPYAPADIRRSVVINAALFPRRMFSEVAFDEHLIYGYDEIDLTSRAVGQGYRIVHCPNAVNYHYPSPVNRDYYAAHGDSARLYVTFKRYRITEGRPVKAAVFLTASVAHVFASRIKAHGLPGVRVAFGVVATAVAAIRSLPPA